VPKPLDAKSKSEQIVLRILRGDTRKQIQKDLNISSNTLRQLLHKRKWETKQLLASDPKAEWPF
jgi:DNA-binding CsgD family transcriptional regulator